jgi:hypothetical protein
MPTEPIFPRHLLGSSDKDRMSYYVNEVIVDHPILTSTLDTLDELANPLLEKRLILLVGGTGVGKSALMKKLVARRISRMVKSISENPQIVPAIHVEVEAPDIGKFMFSSLYRDALAQMNAALIERSLPLVERRTNGKLITTIAIEKSGHRLNPSALKLRFIENLIDRRVDLVCLDEAINIFKVGRSKSEKDRKDQLKDQSDKLKTFVNKTPTSLILGGAYDFLDLTMSSGQIARRSVIIHMGPYTMQDDLEGFATALVGLLAHLPTEHDLDPEKHAAELFLQCLGCVGTLKSILSQAFWSSLTLKQSLTIDLVRKRYFTAAQLEVMRNEMNDGIARVQELLTMEQLAVKAEQVIPVPSQPVTIQSKKLHPGDTKPSHRHDATKSWGN